MPGVIRTDTNHLWALDITPQQVQEFADNPKSYRTDSVSVEKANSTMTFWVPGTKIKAFVQYALGLAYVDKNFKLRRILPMFHPIWTSLWCDAITSINGIQIKKDEVVDFINSVGAFQWKRLECVCTFAMPPYKVLRDELVDKEWERYFYAESQESADAVWIDNGKVKFDDARGVAAGAWNLHNVQSKTPTYRKEFVELKATWYSVPADLIEDVTLILPFATKFLSTQGRINSVAFGSYPAETLMFKTVKKTKFIYPFLSDAVGYPQFGYNIEFTWTYYDPVPKADPAELRHGWNFFPTPDLNYSHAVHDSGRKMFQTSDFNALFTHWSL